MLRCRIIAGTARMCSRNNVRRLSVKSPATRGRVAMVTIAVKDASEKHGFDLASPFTNSCCN